MLTHLASTKPGTAGRVVIADGLLLSRASLRQVLTSWRYDVIGEATTGEHALEVCRVLRPDLLLIDARIPGRDALATTRLVVDVCPETRVAIIVMHPSPHYEAEALRVGAMGYVLKDVTYDELQRVLQREPAPALTNPSTEMTT